MIKKDTNVKTKVLFSLLLAISCVVFAYAAIFSDITQGDFNNGTFVNTRYNTSGSYVELYPGNLTGNFTSQIFNSGFARWNNISWISNAIGELPSNQITETSFGSGNINMTGNVLLVHLNNNSAYGENDTRVYDFSGFENNGTVSGAVFNASGKLSGAYSFDGVDDYINVGTEPTYESGATAISISTWVYVGPPNFDGGVDLIMDSSGASANPGFWLSVEDRNGGGVSAGINTFKTEVASSGGGYINARMPNNVINSSRWYFIAVTYNSSDNIKMYLDGIEQVLSIADSGSGNYVPKNANLYIGCVNTGNTYCFNGSIDEVAIWNRSLSASEILTLYKRGATRLNLTIRSCDDSACSGESFTDINDASPQNLSIANNTYFQYKFDFLTDNVSYTPELYNVTIDYTPDVNAPSITYGSQTETNGAYLNKDNIIINVTANDSFSGLVNITVYLFNISSLVNQTTSTTSPHFVNITGLVQGIYYFNATATDLAGNLNSTATINITLDTTNPQINYGNGTLNDNINISRNFVYVNVTVTEINEANITFRLYNSSGNVNTTTFSAGTRIINWTSLPDGNYTYNATIVDLANNQNTTATRAITLDITTPNASLISPANASYLNNLTQNYTVNLSDNVGIKNATLYIYNASNNLVNQTTINFGVGIVNPLIGIVVTLIDGAYNWSYNLFDFSGNIFTTGNNTLMIDATTPLVSFVGPTPANNSGKSGSIIINVSITDTNLANITYYFNGTITIYNTASGALINLGGGNWVFNVTQSGLTAGSSYLYNVSVRDLANNINSTETRTLLGNSNPYFASILYAPNTSTGLDPNSAISVTINVSDNDDNTDRVVLQWKNSTADWGNATNFTMSNSSALNISTIFNASFTPLYESNYSFRIWVNDTQGATNISTITNVSAFWDCTWTAVPLLFEGTGFNEVKHITNISLNNTGDAAYASNNCSLSFRVTYDLVEGRIYLDGSYFKPSNTYTIAAGANQTITVNAGFLSEIKQENAILTINELQSISNTSSINLSVTLVSTTGGPYLFERITSSPNEVSLTFTNFSLKGYLRNLVADGTLGTIAYNVSFNWSLPSGFLVSNGVFNLTFVNLSNSSLIYNDINISFNSTNLASFSPGVVAVNLHALGLNSSGGFIVHSDNRTLLTEQVNITLNCYNISDGIYVTACGNLDGDYSASGTGSSTSSSSGGGGGGGGVVDKSSTYINTIADMELVRGRQDSIYINFTNSLRNISINNIKFKVEGDIAKYVKIIPDALDSLNPGQTTEVRLLIVSPTYVNLGRHQLSVTLNAFAGSVSYTEKKTLIIEIQEISRKEAEKLINESTILIEKMINANLSLAGLDKILNESITAIKSYNYELVVRNSKIISDTVNAALEAQEAISGLKQLIDSAVNQGINVDGSERILKLALLSMQRGEYEQALQRVKEAQITYALEVKGELAKLSYYIKNNSKEISLAVVLLFMFSFATYKVTKLQLLRRKIRELREEEAIINELIKVVQRQTFERNMMSMEEYEAAMQQYEQKLSGIIEDLIQLETLRAHILRFTSKQKRLKLERERIFNLIKELQKDYLQQGKLETRLYELRLKSYNRRIGEIDSSLAALEAKSALRNKLNPFSFFKE